MWLKAPPGGTFLLSKAPLSDVIVCVVLLLFVQVTVVPTGTVNDAGTKEKFSMETAAGLKSGPVVCPGGGLVWAMPGVVVAVVEE